jgi:type IV secretory pathway protease TraF
MAMAFAAVAFLPVRYVVEGVSMAPGLKAGEVVWSGWFPFGDRWRRPRRFTRWTVALADGTALKRVVGLPGEQLMIGDGDLVIDGRTVLKGPRLLAEMGAPVTREESAASPGHRDDERWSATPQEVLDDSGVEVVRSHVLLPVRDVGVAAVLQVMKLPPEGFVRVWVQVGSRLVPWRLTATGRHAIVAGRLDEHLVAAAWYLTAAGETRDTGRSCLPAGAPPRWQVAEPWPAEANDEPTSPQLAIRCAAPPHEAALEQATLWRDVFYRPGANGGLCWSLGPDECFLLGDQPVASTDSRQWGPIPLSRLRHPVVHMLRMWPTVETPRAHTTPPQVRQPPPE